MWRTQIPIGPACLEFVEFSMLGLNPKEGGDLVWKFVQYYDDGTKEEFTGPSKTGRQAHTTRWFISMLGKDEKVKSTRSAKDNACTESPKEE